MFLKMPGESKITEVFKILDLVILLEGMTCFEPPDGMCACMHMCVHMLQLVGAIEI